MVQLERAPEEANASRGHLYLGVNDSGLAFCDAEKVLQTYLHGRMSEHWSAFTERTEKLPLHRHFKLGRNQNQLRLHTRHIPERWQIRVPNRAGALSPQFEHG